MGLPMGGGTGEMPEDSQPGEQTEKIVKAKQMKTQKQINYPIAYRVQRVERFITGTLVPVIIVLVLLVALVVLTGLFLSQVVR
jgi:hypothetical protein